MVLWAVLVYRNHFDYNLRLLFGSSGIVDEYCIAKEGFNAHFYFIEASKVYIL